MISHPDPILTSLAGGFFLCYLISEINMLFA